MPGARGESVIQTGEREVRLLFTNRALAEAEPQLKRSILAVAQGLSDGTAGITEMAKLLQVGMEAARRDAREGGPPVTQGMAFDVLDAAGFGAVSVAVMEAVAAVLSFGAGEEDSAANPQ